MLRSAVAKSMLLVEDAVAVTAWASDRHEVLVDVHGLGSFLRFCDQVRVASVLRIWSQILIGMPS
jgi:hypothetical protein